MKRTNEIKAIYFFIDKKWNTVLKSTNNKAYKISINSSYTIIKAIPGFFVVPKMNSDKGRITVNKNNNTRAMLSFFIWTMFY